jgi:hypothetical protein
MWSILRSFIYFTLVQLLSLKIYEEIQERLNDVLGARLVEVGLVYAHVLGYLLF